MSEPTAKEIAAEYKVMDDGELTDIYRELDIPGNMSPVDEIKRIKAEIERLRAEVVTMRGALDSVRSIVNAVRDVQQQAPEK